MMHRCREQATSDTGQRIRGSERIRRMCWCQRYGLCPHTEMCAEADLTWLVADVLTFAAATIMRLGKERVWATSSTSIC